MEQKKFIIPKDIDEECINLVLQLNKLDGVETTESCCGHYKERYMIFFQCDNFITLGKLYRCVDRNYSDGNWVIECCCSDSMPTHGFLLISKNVFTNKGEMETSINELISNILYWTQPKFNNYFNGTTRK